MAAAQTDSIEEAWRRLARGDFAGARETSAAVLKRTPEDVGALACHAMASWQLGGDVDAVIAALERAARLAPEVAAIRHNLATVLASKGEIARAAATFREAIALRPEDAEAFYGLSQNHRFNEEDALVRQMRALYAAGLLPQAQREFLCFGLAKAYADLGRHELAMHFCLEANWLAQRSYDAERPRAQLAELRRMAGADAFRRIAGSGNGTRAPLFIVGMPRSGTTLVESVLARHPEVFAGGEMLHAFDVEQALATWARQRFGDSTGVYAMLERLPRDYYVRNAEAVLRRIEAAADRPFGIFTDKLPENSQRLGLIALLFPQARVIHVRRHALDTCISNLFQRFALGHGFAFRQDLLGERYRQVAETMDLWKQALDLAIMDVSYEALVENPEPEIRRIIDFAGLPWDDACLAPEAGSRRIMTASQFQVKQPINRGSVARWKVYEPWIGPLIAALGGPDWIEADYRAGRK